VKKPKFIATDKSISKRNERDRIWSVYSEACTTTATSAPIRQTLHREEFNAYLSSKEVVKIFAYQDDELAGILFFTTDFSLCPWVNEKFFWTKFPKEMAEKKIWYHSVMAIAKKFQRTGINKHLITFGYRHITKELRGRAFVDFSKNLTGGINWAAHVTQGKFKVVIIDLQIYTEVVKNQWGKINPQ
jgi:ribosomal protein S18 acetylase RimI-like enzyme